MKKLLLVLAVAFIFVGCSSDRQRQQAEAKAIEVQTENEILIETLHSGYIEQGIHKITLDTSEYIVVKTGNSGQGVAIIKHN